MAPSSAAHPERLPLLDGLRGMAAIFVMLYHLQNLLKTGDSFRYGFLFVDLFFIISGFVISLSCESRMAEQSAARFMLARIRRLWPIVTIGLLLGAIQIHGSGGIGGLGLLLLLGLLGIPHLVQPGLLFPLNSPQWSIFYELSANLFHAVFLRRMSDRGLVAVIVLSGGLLAATIATYGSADFGPDSYSWYLAASRVSFSYAVGIWLARKRHRFLSWRIPAHASPSHAWIAALLLPPAVMLGLGFLPLSKAAAGAVGAILLMPALFHLATVARPPQAATIWLTRLGAISFPLYAVHMPILRAFVPFGRSLPLAVCAACSTIVAAWLLERVMAARPLAGSQRAAVALLNKLRPRATADGDRSLIAP